MNLQKFYDGQAFDVWTWLGAHYGKDQTLFRTFAPNASRVSLILDGKEILMNRVINGGFHEAIVADVKPGTPYEYRIYRYDGSYTDHCDPYGFEMELRPDHRSIVIDEDEFRFTDEEWMNNRAQESYELPVNVYEMHVGSWKRKDGKWYRYDELTPLLIPYLKEHGYNYVEFLPISEHPVDQSWGYQNTGFFSATSRYGTPSQLKELINELHNHEIGVLLDFVPVHFAIDPYALALYDGSALYEYPNSDVGKSEWGSYNFMHSRGEVRSFLQSCANYWLKEFHFDGLRMDAISRIIYWQGDEKRGVNGNALDFIKVMNMGLKENNPGCILIAEDSTNYPGVTKPVREGGLGFDYKWDMGWMHDTLEYFQASPEYRTQQYHKLTFSMMYFKNEHYMLPYSHDEVVHGKATILQKMNGEYEEKFPQARAMYTYMMVHPGKKLNFMGNEFGQLREWDEKREQDWDLLKYPAHDSFSQFMSALNNIYLTHPALWEWDYKDRGFYWLDCHQESRCIYVIERNGSREHLVALFNFSDKVQKDYTIKLKDVIQAEPLLFSDWTIYGGKTPEDAKLFTLKKEELTCTLPPFSALLLQVEKKEKIKDQKPEENSITDEKR